MKRKKQINRFSYVIMVLIFIVFIGILNYLMPVAPTFKVIKEVCEEKIVFIKQIQCPENDSLLYCGLINKTSVCSQVIIEDKIISFCYSENDCGKIKVGSIDEREEWLDKNCGCLEKECTLSYNYSQRTKVNFSNSGDFVSQTHEGPIEYLEDGSAIFYEPGAQIIEKCGSCQKYQCQNYTIDVIK